jgi:hypothetical protein
MSAPLSLVADDIVGLRACEPASELVRSAEKDLAVVWRTEVEGRKEGKRTRAVRRRVVDGGMLAFCSSCELESRECRRRIRGLLAEELRFLKLFDAFAAARSRPLKEILKPHILGINVWFNPPHLKTL